MTFAQFPRCIFIGFVLILTACDQSQSAPSNLTTGKQLFEYHCSSCHGESGQGLFLKGVPSNRDTELSVAQIVYKIKSDDKDSMPEFTEMPRADAIKIASYLKRINQ